MKRIIALFFVCLFVVQTAVAIPNAIEHPYPEGSYRTDKAWDGSSYQFPKGTAELSAQLVTLKANQQLPWHCHPAPSLGYMLKGTIEVEKPNGQHMLIHQGQYLGEIQNAIHRGKAVGGPAEIIVFHATAKGVKDTIVTNSPTGECK